MAKSKAKPDRAAAPASKKKSETRKAPKSSKSMKATVAAPQKSKAALIGEALRQPDGATLDELMRATQWQRHSVRGFLSTFGKKPGRALEKFTRNEGGTAYKINTEI